MARMIPSFIRESAPPGEKTIFNILMTHRRTADWTVLHSYNLPAHLVRNSGEIDFLILIPEQGIIVLEVKSHDHVSRSEGKWKLGNDPATTRSPFEQASSAMHTLRKSRAAESCANVPFLSLVSFPSVRFTVAATEWEEWQVIDRDDMSPDNFVSAIERALAANISRLRDAAQDPIRRASVAWYRPDEGHPTNNEIERLSRGLRGDFEIHVDLSDIEIGRSQEYAKFLNQQFEAIDSMTANQRVLFEGPPGTGKTLLATEAARRADADGKRVLVLCYNRLLASQLRKLFTPRRGFVGTIHKFVQEIEAFSEYLQTFPDVDFDKLSGVAGHLRLFEDSFDSIVVDEVQDFCSIGASGLLSVLIAQNPNAQVRLFGDFQFQDIQLGQHSSRGQLIDSIGPLVIFALTVNCRNRPGIAAISEIYTGLSCRYSRFRLPDNGLDFQFVDDSHSTTAASLDHAFQSISRNFLPKNVVILSGRMELPASLLGPKLLALATNDYGEWKQNSNKLLSTTIRKFKGLDAEAVILVELPDPLDHKLLFTGISRAIEHITIVSSADLVDRYVKDAITQRKLRIKESEPDE